MLGFIKCGIRIIFKIWRPGHVLPRNSWDRPALLMDPNGCFS